MPDRRDNRRAFIHSRQGRRLIDNKALTADDWRRIADAYEAFLVQVRGIVWDAEHRVTPAKPADEIRC